MRHGLVCLGAILLTGFGVSTAQQQQEKPKETAAATAATDPAKPAAVDERKNPVKVTPEGIATVKKIYGYDCAMCHGAAGDGKGDVAGSMNLKMRDWRDPGVLSALSDGEMYDLIVKGKDKMIGEGDRLPPEKAWNMVHYVRSFAKGEGAKKEGAAKEPGSAPKS